MTILRDTLLAIAIMGCASPVKQAETRDMRSHKWCVIATVEYGRGWIPVMACSETLSSCQFGRRRALQLGQWAGVRSVGECRSVTP